MLANLGTEACTGLSLAAAVLFDVSLTGSSVALTCSCTIFQVQLKKRLNEFSLFQSLLPHLVPILTAFKNGKEKFHFGLLWLRLRVSLEQTAVTYYFANFFF